MKKFKFLMISSLFLFSLLVYGQGRSNGQYVVNAQYGFVPSSGDKTGQFMIDVGVSKIIGDKGFFAKIETIYANYKVDYTESVLLDYNKYIINFNGGYSIETLYPVFINFNAGAFIGYEKANKGKRKDPYFGATIPKKTKGFVYGLSGTAEAEVMIVNNISFLVNYSQFIDFKSDFSKSNYAIFAGLKYYIN